jgi:hypothetical protein
MTDLTPLEYAQIELESAVKTKEAKLANRALRDANEAKGDAADNDKIVKLQAKVNALLNPSVEEPPVGE